MATFSVNQVRHLYVAKTLKSGDTIESTDTVGTILPKADNNKTTMYFQYMSPGGIVSSDKITISNITYTKATPARDMSKKLDRYKLELDPSINGGKPVVGQDYLLRVAFREYIGLSPEDQYLKFGTVHVPAGMSVSDFYKQMALSLVMNLSRDVTPLATVYLGSGETFTEVKKSTKDSDLTGTYDSIIIEQVAQDWILGVMQQAYIPFIVQPTTIISEGDERIWGVVTKVDSVKQLGNGHEIADLEYFTLGFRGDVYRNVGFPNVIHSTYLVDPNDTYDVIDINYYYQGAAEDVQKSPRTLTIVTSSAGSSTNAKAIISKIKSVSGIDIPGIATA